MKKMKLVELLEIEESGNYYQLPELPYTYEALEPHIDPETMIEHHTKHQKGYVDKLNKELSDYPQLKKPLEEIFENIDSYSQTVRNNAGGVWNHTFFWNLLSPEKTLPAGKIKMDILSKWGNIENFKEEFIQVGKGQFGSGWVWLVYNTYDGKLKIISTPNQDNPTMKSSILKPVIGCDVWEHAYYLKHKSDRESWLRTFFEVLNWDFVALNYLKIKK